MKRDFSGEKGESEQKARPLARRAMLAASMGSAGAGMLSAAGILHWPRPAQAQDETPELSYSADQDFAPVPARYYKKLAEGRIECELCPNRCRVADLERGTCGVRENRGGTYYTLVHSRAVSANNDPIEKKPLFHFLPGTTAFSIAAAGCNMECKFCQNWQISQYRPEQVQAMKLTPARVHELAKQLGARSIAYTYSEPTVYYEYMFDTAALGRQTGVRSVAISSGFIEQDPLKELLLRLDAIKIDLKSFRQSFYDQYTRGQLKTVLQSLETIRASGKWLEVVVLIIPTLNDSETEVREMARWTKEHLGAETPVHFTRFHPTYRLRSLPRTPISTLERCREISLAEGLSFVYLGNVPGHAAENTYCPGCRTMVIRRVGMGVDSNRLDKGRCPGCKRAIPGVWS
jgi:pyruvate formate lyase activating enzyme